MAEADDKHFFNYPEKVSGAMRFGCLFLFNNLRPRPGGVARADGRLYPHAVEKEKENLDTGWVTSLTHRAHTAGSKLSGSGLKFKGYPTFKTLLTSKYIYYGFR